MASHLSNANKHPRDDNILLDEPTHIYTIDGASDYLSVTRWVHSFFPHFDADKVITGMMASKKWPKSKYFGKTRDEIKDLWSENGRVASEAGTMLHEDIEYFYNKLPRDNQSIEYHYFQQFYENFKHLKPYRTEWMIYHEEWKFAGSIDMVFENPDGTLQIYDWKRCKKISKTNMFENAYGPCISHLPNSNFWHYTLQLNTYKAILEDKYEKEVTDLYLVCLHPNNTNNSYIRIRVPHLKMEMEELLTLRVQKLNVLKNNSAL